MLLAARHRAVHKTGFGAYVALQRTLMTHFIARGGTAEEFCVRLAPVFRRRYAALLTESPRPEMRTQRAA
jgi:hypothetical protein